MQKCADFGTGGINSVCLEVGTVIEISIDIKLYLNKVTNSVLNVIGVKGGARAGGHVGNSGKGGGSADKDGEDEGLGLWRITKDMIAVGDLLAR